MWLMELLQMQLEALKDALTNVRLRRDRFDKFSYSSWAITETLLAIDDYSGYVCVGTIREILTMQLHDYKSYYNRNKEKNIKYMYAAEIIEYLLTLTEGYIYDEYSINLMGGHIND